MTCPRKYYKNLTPSCLCACPIRQGVNVKENWYSVLTAVNNPDSPGYGYSKQKYNNAVGRGQLFRDKNRKELNQEHWRKGDRAGIPECALIAYLDYQNQKHKNSNNHNTETAERKLLKQAERERNRIKELFRGIVPRAGVKLSILHLLNQRDLAAQQGLELESNQDIALRVGTSRQYVWYIDKQRKGER